MGTANKAPGMPKIKVAAVTTSIMAKGCMDTAFPTISGCSRWLSTCCTNKTMANISHATNQPLYTKAISTATAPVITAPRIGTKEPKNTSIPRGNDKGTPKIRAPKPIPKPSMKATSICTRKYLLTLFQPSENP